MKNKKIIKSLDQILPNEKTKSNILSNVMLNKKRFNYKLLIPILASFILMISLFGHTNTSSTLPIIRSVENEIIFNGECYAEKGIFKGDINDLVFIKESKEFIMGDKIYKINNSIVFQNNDNYIEFIKCERK